GALAGVVNGADVRVVQGAGGAALAAEALQPLGIPGTLLGEELHGDVPVEALLAGPVHHPHAAPTQQAHDPLTRDPPLRAPRPAPLPATVGRAICSRRSSPYSGKRWR